MIQEMTPYNNITDQQTLEKQEWWNPSQYDQTFMQQQMTMTTTQKYTIYLKVSYHL
jgi:hypothetical protein